LSARKRATASFVLSSLAVALRTGAVERPDDALGALPPFAGVGAGPSDANWLTSNALAEAPMAVLPLLLDDPGPST
jgi:hypothetical protein